MNPRERRLLDYIDSGGTKLPKDYEDYQMGGARSDYCVFCGLPNEDYQNTVYSKDPQTGLLTDKHCLCCDSCEEKIASAFKAKAKPLNLSDAAKRRIDQYMDKGLFDDDHVKYRYDPRKVVAISDRASSTRYCYFCQRSGYDTLKPVHAPVTASVYRTGGIVGMCADCEIYSTSQWRNGPTQNDGIHWMKCDSCNSSYTVHDKELLHREGTRYRYNCPRCVEATIKDLGGKVKSIYEERYRLEPEHRHTTDLRCTQCAAEQLFDLYCDRKSLVAACPNATTIKCAKCIKALDSIADAVSESGPSYVIKVATAYEIHVETTMLFGTLLYGYEIYLASGQVIQITEPTFQSLDSAVRDAVRGIHAYEYQSKQ